MTRAVILCGERSTIARSRVDGRYPVDRLRRQLLDLGVSQVILIARPARAGQLYARGLATYASPDAATDLAMIRSLAGSGTEPLLVCEGDLVAQRDALAGVLAGGSPTTTALVGPPARPGVHAPVRREGGRIVAVGSAYHEVNGADSGLRGVLRVVPADLPAVVAAGARLAGLAGGTGRPLESLAGDGGLVGLLALALARGGTRIDGHAVGDLVAERVTDAESLTDVRRRIAAVDERAVARRRAVKRIAGRLVRPGSRYPRFGGWGHRFGAGTAEALAYLGLAIGADRLGQPAWVLAGAALTVLVLRTTTASAAAAWRGAATDRLSRLPLEQHTDAGLPPPLRRAGGRVARLLAWRWVAVLVAAPFGPRAALAVAVGCGLVGLGQAVVLGVRASRSRLPSPPRALVELYRDSGALARVLGGAGRDHARALPAALAGPVACGALAVATRWDGAAPGWVPVAALALLVAGLADRAPHGGIAGWLVPPVLRLGEALFLVVVGVAGGVPAPLLLALLGVTALYHLDLAARRGGERAGRGGDSPVGLRWLDLGWDGRTALLAVAVPLGMGTEAATALVCWLALAFAGTTLAGLTAREVPDRVGPSAAYWAAPAVGRSAPTPVPAPRTRRGSGPTAAPPRQPARAAR